MADRTQFVSELAQKGDLTARRLEVYIHESLHHEIHMGRIKVPFLVKEEIFIKEVLLPDIVKKLYG